MNTRNTIILVVVLIALGAYVYFGEMGSGQTPSATPTPSVSTLWSLPADHINRLEVHDLQTKQEARLVKDSGGAWQIEAPITDTADATRLNSLTSRLAKITASRVITNPPADLAPFGLVTHTMTVDIGLTENQTQTLQVGDKNPQGFSYYVQQNDNPAIYLVTSSLIDDLRRLITKPPRKPTPTPTFTATPAVTQTATPEAIATPSATSAP